MKTEKHKEIKNYFINRLTLLTFLGVTGLHPSVDECPRLWPPARYLPPQTASSTQIYYHTHKDLFNYCVNFEGVNIEAYLLVRGTNPLQGDR